MRSNRIINILRASVKNLRYNEHFVQGLAIVDVCLLPPVDVSAREPELASVKEIRAVAAHKVFTDLCRIQNGWWCVFREAVAHGTAGEKFGDFLVRR
ncbi:MAG: hypothetical protein MK110_11955 [Fuerstiella sp.]|nr:hypothetical protein [Fuerstiella sp.]